MQPIQWLDRGWDDLKNIGVPGLAHGALIAVLGGVLLMLGSTHLYLTAAAVSGYLLVGPVMTTGACELARRHAAGERSSFDDSLQALTRNPDGLTHFGGILALVAVIWFVFRRCCGNPCSPPLCRVWPSRCGADPPRDPLRSSWATWSAGAMLAGIVFCLSVVAVPLIIDRHATASEAIRASARVARQPAGMLLWAALIVGLTVIGFVTFLLGMIVIAPLLGYATWHAYRDLVA